MAKPPPSRPIGPLRRLLLTRLVAPIVRGRHSAAFSARGVFFGVLVALTPTVGVQMPLVFLLWLAVRALQPRWEFNLLVGLAWTWVTNIVTVPPFYYAFYLTGRLMMGLSGPAHGYDSFAAMLEDTLSTDAGWLETLWVYTWGLFERFGVPMFVGCIPWALLGAWVGYRWSLGFILRIRAARERRRQRRRASQLANRV